MGSKRRLQPKKSGKVDGLVDPLSNELNYRLLRSVAYMELGSNGEISNELLESLILYMADQPLDRSINSTCKRCLPNSRASWTVGINMSMFLPFPRFIAAPVSQAKKYLSILGRYNTAP